MSDFRELYRLFPEQMYKLCLEECYIAQRPVYEFEPEELGPDGLKCDLCPNPAVFEFIGYMEGGFDKPYPNAFRGRLHTCDNDLCKELHAWLHESYTNRMTKFKGFYGKRVWEVDAKLRVEALLAFKLSYESSRIANAGKTNLRLAA